MSSRVWPASSPFFEIAENRSDGRFLGPLDKPRERHLIEVVPGGFEHPDLGPALWGVSDNWAANLTFWHCDEVYLEEPAEEPS